MCAHVFYEYGLVNCNNTSHHCLPHTHTYISRFELIFKIDIDTEWEKQGNKLYSKKESTDNFRITEYILLEHTFSYFSFIVVKIYSYYNFYTSLASTYSFLLWTLYFINGGAWANNIHTNTTVWYRLLFLRMRFMHQNQL